MTKLKLSEETATMEYLRNLDPEELVFWSGICPSCSNYMASQGRCASLPGSHGPGNGKTTSCTDYKKERNPLNKLPVCTPIEYGGRT